MAMSVYRSGTRRARVFLIIGVTLFHLIGAFADDPNEEASRHFAAGQKAQNAGNLEEAAQEYLKVIQLLPDAAEAYASLGLVYNAQKKYIDSAQALSKAERLKPGLPGVSLYLGIDDVKRHQPALAVPYLKEAIRLEPKNEQSYMWLSEAFNDDGQTIAALEELQKASRLFPSDSALLLNLGRLYRKCADQEIGHILKAAKGKPLQHQVYGDIYKDERVWPNALAHYSKALDLDPQWHGAHFGMGEVAFENAKFDYAIKEYRRELDVDPHSAAAMARLGEVELLEGNPNDALDLFNSAIKASPEEATHALGLPRSYPASKGELNEEAKDQLRKCLPFLEKAPPDPARNLALAAVYFLLEQKDAFDTEWKRLQQNLQYPNGPTPYSRALADFNRLELNAAEANVLIWLNAYPDDLQARYLLAKTYQTLSFYTLEQLLVAAPDSYPAHQAVASIYEESQDYESALREFRVAEGMAPSLPGIHFSIAGLLLKLHRQDEALGELQAELKLDPDHPEANADMGEIFLDRTDSAKAIPYLERAVRQEPSLWSAHEQLAKAYYMQKDYTKAIVELQQTIKHDPDGSAHYQLGMVYRALGYNQQAGEQFEISRKIKIENLSHAENEMTTFQNLPQ